MCRVSSILFFEQFSRALTISTIVLGDGYQILLERNKTTAAQAFDAGHTAGDRQANFKWRCQIFNNDL
jgi:hypothetical protein